MFGSVARLYIHSCILTIRKHPARTNLFDKLIYSIEKEISGAWRCAVIIQTLKTRVFLSSDTYSTPLPLLFDVAIVLIARILNAQCCRFSRNIA